MRFRNIYSLLILSGLTVNSHAQSLQDSVFQMKEINVNAYFSPQPLLSSAASVNVIDISQFQKQSGNSMIPLLNTVSGIRMEERSPGSYRLSIRGSLLRSPFGVRNVKIYLDDFALTDASGNTYLNALDVAALSNIEILKGPDGSIFGANSGGVVILKPNQAVKDSTDFNLQLNSGSYGLFHEVASAGKKWDNYGFNITQSFQRSDGYRDNSFMRRHYFQANQHWNYHKLTQLRLLAFYSDLQYKTPGGLTRAQMEGNPKAARQATPTLPGAVTQQAGIFAKTFFSGLAHEVTFSERLRHVVALTASTTKFDNPFITNYESRQEQTFGLRSYIELSSKKESSLSYKWNTGLEWQKSRADISNFGNRSGQKDTIQAADRIKTDLHFFFSRFSSEIFKDFNVEASLSLNAFNFAFSNLPASPNPYTSSQRSFKNQLMPRLAASYRLNDLLAIRASVSKGYSPPTNAEVRSNDNVINTNLEAEKGWNYETGIRMRDKKDRLYADVSVFHYQLNEAIVRRVNTNETEYFINAGGTRQLGVESQIAYWLIEPETGSFIKGLQLQNAFTWSNFNFNNYQTNTIDYSGKRLTGVPKNVIVSGLQLIFPKNLSLFAQHNYTSSIPLNDANTVYAAKYNLLQAKASWQLFINKSKLEVFAGADNILNEKYSLGNDLNAVGNRFFNPAAPRNFYAGINYRL
jgi:iron complex outermembrane receptor protein